MAFSPPLGEWEETGVSFGTPIFYQLPSGFAIPEKAGIEKKPGPDLSGPGLFLAGQFHFLAVFTVLLALPGLFPSCCRNKHQASGGKEGEQVP